MCASVQCGLRAIREKLSKIGKKIDFFENSQAHKLVHILFTKKQVAYSESIFNNCKLFTNKTCK